MKKQALYWVTLSCLFGSLTACNSQTERKGDGTDSLASSATVDRDTSTMVVVPNAGDTTFATEAALSGLAEVELGQLALEKADEQQVKDFADMMVKDHGKANEELQKIASDKKIMLPTALDLKHANIRDDLLSKSGAEFDKAYVAAMVDGHEKTYALMQEGAKNMVDEQLRAFAEKTAPIVKVHLERIKAIQAQLK
ncbi:DUF4142 domain-containing protein [Sphingobacterium suaedae]|uniref:DUF4142 domain-containing protein n=1 Tax=Sphingobacterium suaedae TaxID=1686402 RepID=A0ABW5KI48_9SPHI